MVGRSKTVGGRWIVNQRSKYGEAWPMQMSCRLLRYSSEFGSCPNFVVCGSERAWPLEHDNYTTWAGACSVVRVRCCLQWRLAGTKRKEEGKRNASHMSLKSRDDHLAGWVVWIWYVYNICVVSVLSQGFCLCECMSLLVCKYKYDCIFMCITMICKYTECGLCIYIWQWNFVIGGLSLLIFSMDTNCENMTKEASEKLPQGQLSHGRSSVLKGRAICLIIFLFGSMQRDGKHHMGISWNGGTAKSNIIRL